MAKEAGLNLQFNQAGSVFGLFFTAEEVYDYDSAKNGFNCF